MVTEGCWIITIMQAGWSIHIMFYLFAFPEPTMLSVNQAYFWPTFTCIPKSPSQTSDCGGLSLSLLVHCSITSVPMLWTSCDSTPGLWDSLIVTSVWTHCGTCPWFNRVSNAHTQASQTKYLWDTMYACIDTLAVAPSGEFWSGFSHPSVMYFSPLWLLICLACCLLNITVLD